MIISIIGTGYVGLVTGASFADYGHKVYCVDIDEAKINTLKQGQIPFFEPGLEELVKRNFNKKRLIFTTSYAQAIPSSKVVFICVGTPPAKTGEADLSSLFSSAQEVAKYLKGYTLIAIKSTVPIGVEKDLQEIIGKASHSKFEFASCPEFLKEGSAIEDFRSPDRIVIGTQSKKAADILLDLYQHFNGQRLICDLRSAQMIKYASNTFLATKITFANAIANIAERLGADAEVVLEGLGLDKRIGKAFLRPSIGFGGSCFPKDTSAFIDIAKKSGYKFELLEAVERLNNLQTDLFIKKIITLIGVPKDKIIAALGLSFKANTDDIRESPALKVIQKLLAMGAKIKVYDPSAMPNTKKVLNGKISYEKGSYEAVTGAEALLILTEWNEFKELDLAKIHKLMAKPIIVDGRNIYDPKKVKQLGFTYQGIGRS